jgi:hypothetical protein
MSSVDCEVCADRYRRHWTGVVLAVLLSPVLWGWAVLAVFGRLFRVRPHRPRLCFLAGNRPLRREVKHSLRSVIAELAQFETRAVVDLVVVQDRVTRADGEPLRVSVQRTRRGNMTLLAIRLALHARGTCYGAEAVAATLADTLITVYEREAQATPVLEVPARVCREAPSADSPALPRQNGTGKGSMVSTPFEGTTALARGRPDNEADGTVTQFKQRPGGLSTNDHA